MGAIRAVLFDLDGTLVDTERETDAAIEAVLAARGKAGVRLGAYSTRGRTWHDIAVQLITREHLAGSPEALAEALLAAWLPLVAGARPILGAQEALEAARASFAIGVVSSSPRAVVDGFLERLGVSGLVPEIARVGGDEVRSAKPDPEGFLRAAAALAVEPSECLVFEDSRAGLEAARAAGMASIAVLAAAAEPETLLPLATGSITHYRALPAGFWQDLAREGMTAIGTFR